MTYFSNDLKSFFSWEPQEGLYPSSPETPEMPLTGSEGLVRQAPTLLGQGFIKQSFSYSGFFEPLPSDDGDDAGLLVFAALLPSSRALG